MIKLDIKSNNSIPLAIKIIILGLWISIIYTKNLTKTTPHHK